MNAHSAPPVPRYSTAAVWYALSFVRELIPIFPVYAILMQERGLSPHEISMLLIVWSLAALLFEVPTGVIGDHFPRRQVLMVSRLLQASAFALWWFEPTFWGFLFGFVIWGLAGSLWSGTAEALLYETLAAKGQREQFERIYARGSAFATCGIAAALAFGGYLAVNGYTLPLMLSVAVSALTGGFLFAVFGNPPRALREDVAAETVAAETAAADSAAATGSDNGTPLTLAIGDFKRRPAIRQMTLIIGFALVFFGCFEEYVGLLFDGEGLALGSVGVWYAVCYGTRAAAMSVAHRVQWDPLLTLVAAGLLLGGATLLSSTAVLVAGCALYFALNGIAEVRVVNTLQSEQSGRARATVMSLARLLMLATGPLVYVAIATAADGHGWIASAWVAAIGCSGTAALLKLAPVARRR